ncbi:hypothetical protein HYALB_00008227 [Hymenoscyphus albidus]|uniref:Lysine-specific metallo-endopeptidase domain-containing protein n=1 Tax=Hymenoscyphus albidus TaxID=595503 RepID=A0A9N9LQL7_9HELO|nr:hypothetical protein HYALB_00008227 [Hymenoscyphus albidus]
MALYSVTRFRLSLFYLILLLTFKALAALPKRTLWFHDSCSEGAVGIVWEEMQDMLRLASPATNLNAWSDAGKYFRLVWGDNREDTFKFVKDTVDAVNPEMATLKEDANTYIYCDDDERWSPPGKTPGIADDLWYDAENRITFKPTTSFGGLQPGCKYNDDDKPPGSWVVNGQTYCDVLPSGKRGSCAISICKYISDYVYVAVSQTEVSPQDSSANYIDQYVFFSGTLLHELAHTIENYYTGDKWKDRGPHPYRWQAVVAKKGTEALTNAENLAYWGLGCILMSRGVAINENGGFRILRPLRNQPIVN